MSGYLRNLRGRLLSSEKFSEVFALWFLPLSRFQKTGSISHFAFSLVLQCLGSRNTHMLGRTARKVSLSHPFFRKIRAPIKIKSALPPKKTQITLPSKMRNFMDMSFSCRKNAFSRRGDSFSWYRDVFF